MVAGSISKRGLGLIDGAKPFADEAAESGVAAARIVLGRVRMLTGPRGKRMIGMNEGVRGVLPGYFVNRETQLDATVVAQWAYKERLWRPDPIDPVRMLARQLSRAWRQEYYVDRQGREVRLNHHVSIEQEDGQHLDLWIDHRTARPEQMRLSFQQQRQGMLADCKQEKIDFDSYVENNPWRATLPQMDFDFNKDLEELAQPASYPNDPQQS
jgi:hypothetical protein